MKMTLNKLGMIAIATLSILTIGCSKSDNAQNTADSSAGGLQATMSQQGVNKVTIAALPQAKADTPLEQYVKLDSGNQVMFAYYAISNLPIDYEKIALSYSNEYRQTSDEFKKRDILNSLKPRIDAEISKAKEQRYWKVTQGANLSHFDFDKKTFAENNPLLQDGGYIYFDDNNAYNLSITNGESFRTIKVDDENKARQIEKNVNNAYSAPMNNVFYVFVQDVDQNKSTVKCQIIKSKLLDKSGNDLVM